MEISFVDENDQSKCNDLYNKTYNKSRSLFQWRWEFTESINPENTIPYAVAKEKGKIVGTWALMPVQMIDERGVFWAAKSEEAIVVPKMRGKGVFNELSQTLFEYAQKTGLKVIWGFTTAVSAHQKIGFKTPVNTSQLFFPLSFRSVDVIIEKYQDQINNSKHKIYLKFYQAIVGIASILSLLFLKTRNNFFYRKYFNRLQLSIRTLAEPPNKAEELCKDFIDMWGGVTVYRDYKYLKWRICENPYLKPIFRALYKDEKLLGWIAYSLDVNSIGYIVDIFIASKKGDKSLCLKAIMYLLVDTVLRLRRMGALAIRSWRVNSHPFDKELTKVAKKIGFYHLKNKGFPFVLRYVNTDIHSSSLNDINNWYISRIYTEGWLG